MSDSNRKTCSVEECAGRYHARGFCYKHYRQGFYSGELKPTAHLTRSPIERFLERIVIADSGCWEWQGGGTPLGYGHIIIGSKRMITHRFSYEHYLKPIPEGLHLLHHCDNPPCCNPLHLYPGTDADNARDKVSRERQPRGEAHYNAKLTDEKVREIRRAYANGQTAMELGRVYSVDANTVWAVVHRHTWEHVE